MYQCPHCRELGISLLAKLWSGSSSPAKCRHCGGLSYVATLWHINVGIIAAIPTLVGLLLLWLLDSFLPLLIGQVIQSGVYAVGWHRASMLKTSRVQLNATKPFGWALVALAALVVTSLLLAA